MNPMPAPAESVPSDDHEETVSFLRRLSSMLTGGRNAETLLEAASMIETLGKRAAIAEQLFHVQQQDHAHNLERREVAELASDNLTVEVESLRAEVDLLKTEVDEGRRQTDIERRDFAEEMRRQRSIADAAEARLAEISAELEALREPSPAAALDDSIAVVPVQSLQLARAQFDYLAEGFAGKGDVVSQTICEIGARALDKALAGSTVSSEFNPL